MAGKNKTSDTITKAMLSCGGKVKGKSKKKNKNNKVQKLALGGLFSGSDNINTLDSNGERMLFDSENLTDKEKRELYGTSNNPTSLDQQQNILNSKYIDENGEPIEGSADADSEGALLDAVGDIFGVNVSELVGGISEGIDTISSDGGEDSDIAEGIVQMISPELADTLWAGEHRREERKAARESNAKATYFKTREDQKFADGGQVPDDDPQVSAAKEIVDYMKISSPEFNEEIQKNISSIPKMKEVPIGTDKEGNMLTEWREDQSWSTAKVIEGDYRPQASNELRNTLSDYSGIDYETIDSYDRKSDDFKKQLEENLESTLESLKSSGKREYQNVDLNVTKDSQGNYTYGVRRLDKKRTTSLDNNTQEKADGGTVQKLADGGEIEGKGTGKSDSINAELPAGSYILPADAPDYVTKRLTRYLGYDDAKLNHSDGEKVKVSDGEILILPEDVGKADEYVRRLGYDNGLDEIAPNAKYKLSERPGYADGGQIGNVAGTIAGAGQVLMGMFGSSQNEEPKSDTEQLLRNLSNEVRMRAEYGLNPYERTQAEQAIERSFAAERDIINNVSGGSLDVVMNNAAAAAMRTNNARLGLEVQSSKLQEDKERYADEVTMKAIAANERDFERKYNKYLSGEEVAADLISSGIGNIIGQSQMNQYEKSMNDEREKDRNVNKNFLDEILKRKEKSTDPTSEAIEKIVSQNTDWIGRTELHKGI